jgi:predicted ribosome quality control (RQC) complex YloA/Tae2 family protein
MKVKNFSFNEGKDKFPDIRTLDIDGFIVYIGRDAKSNDHLTFYLLIVMIFGCM